MLRVQVPIRGRRHRILYSGLIVTKDIDFTQADQGRSGYPAGSWRQLAAEKGAE